MRTPPRRYRRAAGLALPSLLVAALAAAPGAAQEKPAQEKRAQEKPKGTTAAPFGERIEVELVGVEVWVTDTDGRPVEGLSADDFEVRHDGVPVGISHFSEIRSGVLVPAPEIAEEEGRDPAVPVAAAAEPGHLILYFDQLRLDPDGYRGALEGVRRLLADGTLAAERLLVLRQDTGLHIEAPLGSSAAEIEAALGRVASGAHAGLAAASELQQAKEAILGAWEAAEDLSGTALQGLSAATPGGAGGGAGGPRGAVGGGGGSVLPSACDVFTQRAQLIVDAWTRERGSQASITLAHLTATAGFLSGLPGVKTLLYVSDGLDLEPGAALAGYVSDFCPTHGRRHEMRSIAEGLGRDFRALADRFNAHRVTLHAVQGSGLRTSDVAAASERGTRAPVGGRARFESRQRQSDRSGMSLLADETGGRSVFNRNDVSGELAAISRDMGHYYSLAYPPPPGDEGGENRIELKLRDRSLAARYRHGFRAPDPDEWMAERLAGALHLGIISNPLEMRLGIGEQPPNGGGRLRLYAMVPVERLVFVPGDGGAVAHVELRGSVRSSGSAAPDAVGAEFRLRKPPGAADERVNLPLELDLGPGAHRVAVGLRDLASGEASFVTTSFEIEG